MNRHFVHLTALAVIGLCVPVSAGTLSFQGTFTTDDTFQAFGLSIASPGTLILRTFGYAGGVNAAGVTVAAGGFDPVLTLFDGDGNFLVSNNDGACAVEVGKDPSTGNCFDSYLSINTLTAGMYTLVLTESDNLAIGPTLWDSFLHAGEGNFTCMEFMGTPGGFCDASPSQRTNAWALDITMPGDSPTPVPEPAPAALYLTGLGLMVALRHRLSFLKTGRTN